MTSLYFHIPFCRSKCSYCDFFSIAADTPHFDAYPELLRKQLQLVADQGWTGPIDTIYFGGGTPSLFSPDTFARLLTTAERHFGLSPDAEISLEANPGTVSAEQLAGYRAAGINRLSLGLQTMATGQLQRLGRAHSREDGLQAVQLARLAGFDNLSLDLIFALPNQTMAELNDELDAYLDLNPEHLSCYGLTAEPGTPFELEVSSGKVKLPDESFYADAFMQIHNRLSNAGFEHYEIANYAKPGRSCRHNRNYWQRRPYLGVGAGAHSFSAQGWGRRLAVPNDLQLFQQRLAQQQDPADHLESFDRQGALSETIYLALRTAEGVSDTELQQMFDTTLVQAFPEAVQRTAPWLCRKDDHTSMTPTGWLIFDQLIQPFL